LIETDDWFSKVNYRSRRNYAIEIAILEKCLVLDNSLIETKLIIYNIVDL